MNARATRRPRGRAGSRPSGRSTGGQGPAKGCKGLAAVALFSAGALLGALGYGIAQIGGWL